MVPPGAGLGTCCQPSQRRSKGCVLAGDATSTDGLPESVTTPVEDSIAWTCNKGAARQSSALSSSTTSTQSPQRNLDSSSFGRPTCTSMPCNAVTGKTTEPFARDHLKVGADAPPP